MYEPIDVTIADMLLTVKVKQPPKIIAKLPGFSPLDVTVDTKTSVNRWGDPGKKFQYIPESLTQNELFTLAFLMTTASETLEVQELLLREVSKAVQSETASAESLKNDISKYLSDFAATVLTYDSSDYFAEAGSESLEIISKSLEKLTEDTAKFQDTSYFNLQRDLQSPISNVEEFLKHLSIRLQEVLLASESLSFVMTQSPHMSLSATEDEISLSLLRQIEDTLSFEGEPFFELSRLILSAANISETTLLSVEKPLLDTTSGTFEFIKSVSKAREDGLKVDSERTSMLQKPLNDSLELQDNASIYFSKITEEQFATVSAYDSSDYFAENYDGSESLEIISKSLEKLTEDTAKFQDTSYFNLQKPLDDSLELQDNASIYFSKITEEQFATVSVVSKVITATYTDGASALEDFSMFLVDYFAEDYTTLNYNGNLL